MIGYTAAPLKGYPFTHQEQQNFKPADKMELIKKLTLAGAKAEVIHSLALDVYFDFSELVKDAKHRTLMNRLEHSARILENVAYQLMELTSTAKKEVINEADD